MTPVDSQIWLDVRFRVDDELQNLPGKLLLKHVISEEVSLQVWEEVGELILNVIDEI